MRRSPGDPEFTTGVPFLVQCIRAPLEPSCPRGTQHSWTWKLLATAAAQEEKDQPRGHTPCSSQLSSPAAKVPVKWPHHTWATGRRPSSDQTGSLGLRTSSAGIPAKCRFPGARIELYAAGLKDATLLLLCILGTCLSLSRRAGPSVQ